MVPSCISVKSFSVFIFIFRKSTGGFCNEILLARLWQASASIVVQKDPDNLSVRQKGGRKTDITIQSQTEEIKLRIPGAF